MAKISSLILLLAAAVTAAVLVSPPEAWAQAAFTVDSTVDAVDASPGDGVCATSAGACTLRAAIQEANALAGADSITLLAGTYTLAIAGTNEDAGAIGDLDIADDLTINGAGATTTITDGAYLDRVFDVGVGVIAVISGLTIRNGTSQGGLTGGGGIINSGTTTLTNSTVSGNSSPHGVGGGGIYNSGGTLTLGNSTVSGNSTVGTSSGGGILNGGTLTLANSTVSGNTTTGLGGGIYNYIATLTLTNSTVSGNASTGVAGGGGILNYGTLTLTSSTVSGNSTASPGGGAGGGGILNYGTATLTNGTVTGNTTTGPGGAGILASGTEDLRNTIVAGNGPAGGDCSGAITSAGHNLDGDGSCGLTGPGDLTNVNPLLGPLADNGGPTETHALFAASPAVDAGDNVGCPTTDQRGASRPLIERCDIGAYEYGDTDADGVPDGLDNCPTVANAAGQLDDVDGDYAGDACDGPGTGNVDCSPTPPWVSAVDALKVLRHRAGLSVSQNEPCLDIGEPRLVAPGWKMGDVDCSGAVTAVDALKILRAVVGLSVTKPAECPEIIIVLPP